MKLLGALRASLVRERCPSTAAAQLGRSLSRASRSAYHHISDARNRRHAAGFTGFYGLVRRGGFLVRSAGAAGKPPHLKMAPKIDLHETRQAAPGRIRPFIGGRLVGY